MRDSLSVEIVRIRQENPEVVTLYFVRPFDFIAGQYITVYIPDSVIKTGKAYSLSSRPFDEYASITVKNVGGEFSSFLCSRQVGDNLYISQAYGDFNPQTVKPLVGIAAGCGLGPIWSVLTDSGMAQDRILYFTHRSPEFTVFDEELAKSDIVVRHFSTQQKVEGQKNWTSGRFNVAAIVHEVPADAHFLVCGAVGFVRDVWQRLTANGVDGRSISTETFFES